jgi:hypothetical protein
MIMDLQEFQEESMNSIPQLNLIILRNDGQFCRVTPFIELTTSGLYIITFFEEINFIKKKLENNFTTVKTTEIYE